MSKALAIVLHFAQVAWIAAVNYRRDYGDTDRLRTSLTEREWVQDNVVQAFPLDNAASLGYDVPALLAGEMDLRQKLWDTLKADQSKEGLVKLAVFVKLYTVNGDGKKLVEPTYFGNSGFRRHSVFFAAMIDRYNLREKPDYAGIEITGSVPIRPMTYANKADQIFEQQLENAMQNVGTKQMEDLEKLRVTHDLFQAGAKQVRIRHLYPGSTGQKLFSICLADLNWPTLKIYDRFHLPESHPDRIKWGPVRQQDVTKFNNRFDAVRKEKDGLPLTPAEQKELLPPITLDDLQIAVDNYFRDASRGKDDESAKMMKKGDIASLARVHRCTIVRRAMDSVIGDVQTNLQKFVSSPDCINLATELYDLGGQEAGKTILTPLINDQTDTTPEGKTVAKRVFNDKAALALVGAATLLIKGQGDALIKAIDLINNPPPVEEKKPEPTPAATPPTAPNGGKKQQTGGKRS